MKTKTKKIVDNYFSVLKLHLDSCTRRSDSSNYMLMYRSYFNCMRDLELLTEEELIDIKDKMMEMFLELPL